MNRCLFVLCIWASVASAHIGTRVFPFYELTDEMLETIDIHDGSVEEWYQIGEPSMTLLDFKQGNDDLDPSDLDFRIWLAWHDESNRIYAAVTTIDDLYYNEHNYITEEGPGNMFYYDSILFTLDADHSGGTGRQERFNYAHEELLELYGNTQWYSVIAQTESGPTIDNDIRIGQENPLRNSIGTPDSWMIFPPYGDAGGMVEGEKPALSVIEMYVTPYDWWGALDDLEQIGFSELSAYQIIGFSALIHESEGRCAGCRIFYVPEEIGDDHRSNWLYIYDFNRADVFIDGLLLPAQDTSVGSITWGRIKASLQP